MKDPPANKFGTCALCHAQGTLRDSHIIPEFLYGPIYDDKHRMILLETDERYPSFEQKGICERLLCQACETKLSKWETYARGVLVGGVPLDVRRDCGVRWVEGIDYQRFKLFQLSVLWRAGASKHVFFSKQGKTGRPRGTLAANAAGGRSGGAVALLLPDDRN